MRIRLKLTFIALVVHLAFCGRLLLHYAVCFICFASDPKKAHNGGLCSTLLSIVMINDHVVNNNDNNEYTVVIMMMEIIILWITMV